MANSTGTTPSAGRFQPPEVRQRQILEALAALAVERGMGEVSVAAVAERAGVAKGSIYLHYRSRQDLVDALQAHVWDEMLGHPREIVVDDSLTWLNRLDQVVEHLARFESEHQELYHAVFHTSASGSDEPWTESRSLMQGLVEGGAAAGEFDVVDVDVTADFLVHGYAGPCYHHHDLDQVVATLQALFRRAVGVS